MLNQTTYEKEYQNYDSTIKALSTEEINQIKNQIETESSCFENEEEMLYFIAVDWSITIAVVKQIMSL
jgi:hypothetical protein